MYKFNIFNQREIDRLRSENVFIHTKNLEHNGGLILVGRGLKQVYLDELPQLWNILRGEMSIVGPRPLNEEVYKTRGELVVPAVSLIKGGMTGLFQSYKGKEGRSAIELNAEYLKQYRTRSGLKLVFYDLWIILRTIKVMLCAKGV